jgi:hypothetical protein
VVWVADVVVVLYRRRHLPLHASTLPPLLCARSPPTLLLLRIWWVLGLQGLNQVNSSDKVRRGSSSNIAIATTGINRTTRGDFSAILVQLKTVIIVRTLLV